MLPVACLITLDMTALGQGMHIVTLDIDVVDCETICVSWDLDSHVTDELPAVLGQLSRLAHLQGRMSCIFRLLTGDLQRFNRRPVSLDLKSLVILLEEVRLN